MSDRQSNDFWNTKVYLQSAKIHKISPIKYTQNGLAVATVTVMIYQGKNPDGSFKDSIFKDVNCWGDLAEYVVQLQPKQRVYVEGSLKQNSWVDKTTNQKRYKEYINADKVEFVDAPATR